MSNPSIPMSNHLKMKAEKTPFDEEMRMATRGYFGGLGGFSKKFCQMRCVFGVPVGCGADWRRIK